VLLTLRGARRARRAPLESVTRDDREPDCSGRDSGAPHVAGAAGADAARGERTQGDRRGRRPGRASALPAGRARERSPWADAPGNHVATARRSTGAASDSTTTADAQRRPTAKVRAGPFHYHRPGEQEAISPLWPAGALKTTWPRVNRPGRRRRHHRRLHQPRGRHRQRAVPRAKAPRCR
jgi:hypothetical protein